MRTFRSSLAPWTEGEGYAKRIVLDEAGLGIGGSFLQEVSFKKGERVPAHHHKSQTEVFYAITKAAFEINGQSVVMEPGDVVVCEPGDVHGNPIIREDMKVLVLKINFKDDDTIWHR